MKAVICAAGDGERLRPFTSDRPKCLVKIGDKTILEYMLDNLLSCGIKETVIIAGYNSQKFDEMMGKRYKNCRIKYYVNKDYAKTDNMYSLWMARKEISDGVILMNSDLVFDTGVLKRLVQSNFKDALAVDKNAKFEQGSMRVKSVNGKLVGMIRNLKKNNGRAVGIYKFSAEGAKKYYE